MTTNRFFTLLVIIALLTVTALTVREAFATKVVVSHASYTHSQSHQQPQRVFLHGEWNYCSYIPQPICRR